MKTRPPRAATLLVLSLLTLGLAACSVVRPTRSEAPAAPVGSLVLPPSTSGSEVDPAVVPASGGLAGAPPRVIERATGPGAQVAQPATRLVLLGQLVTLRPTIEVQVGGTGSTLIFEGIEQDSRCPADVSCVQAGSVTVLLHAWDGRAAHRAALTLAGSEAVRARLGALEVTLQAVEPEPTSGGPIRPFDYRAAVTVERAGGPTVANASVTPTVRGTPVTPAAAVTPVITATPAATATQAATGVDGVITVGPMCPVQRVDQPCPDRPYPGTLVFRTSTGASAGRVQADASGRFALDLPAGRYVITPQLAGPFPSAAPLEVLVPALGRAFVTVAYDSGIR